MEDKDIETTLKRYQKMFELARAHMKACPIFAEKVLEEFENE